MAFWSFVVFAFIGFKICIGQNPLPRPRGCWNVSASEQDVADKYFTKYGKWQRPRLNSSHAVDVTITFVLSSINDVLEKERIIKVTAYISTRWIDEFRVWKDDFPYNCVDYVVTLFPVVPSDEVWLPDIAQMNSEGRYTLMKIEGEKVRIYSNGYTIFSPGGTFMAFCDYDLTYFPFDTQRCAIKFESWRYTAVYMTFRFGNNVTIKGWSENEQWSLVRTDQAKINLTYLDPGNSFDHIEFYIIMKRKLMYYMMNVIIPSCIISVAQLATFALPVDEVLKVHISFTCLLAYSVFQLMVVNDMPRSSDHVPLLSVYIDVQMASIAVSTVFEGFVFVAVGRADPENSQSKQDVPAFTYYILGLIGRALGVGKPPKRPTSAFQDRYEEYDQASLTPEAFSSEVDMLPQQYASIFENVPINVSHKQTSLEAAYATMHRQQAKEADENNEHSPHRRRRRWRYIADVLDRISFMFYFSCLIVTPLVIFWLYPFSSMPSGS